MTAEFVTEGQEIAKFLPAGGTGLPRGATPQARRCHKPSDEDRRPVIVLCHGRSGSTLLAYVLNSNPVLYCPAETNLGQTLLGVARWAAEIARNPEGVPGEELVGESHVAVIRDLVDALYSERLHAERATRWCDKSLGTHVASELIDRLFPDAQFICLYRNFLDFAASALETCPYGLHNYGFDPYAQETPGNAIFSLARYWVDNVRAITAFQDAHPRATFALTYERLVKDFDATIADLGVFLDAPWDDASLSSERIFRQRYWTGFQDHKITATSRVRTESVNRHWICPIHMIPPPVIEAINELHARLGYPAVDKPEITDGTGLQHLEGHRLAELDQVVAAIKDGMGRISGALSEAGPVVIRLDIIDVGVSVELLPLRADVSWHAPITWDVRITATVQVLRDATSGKANVASLMTNGQLKTEITEQDPPDLAVVATLHHFWRAISDPEYAYAPTPSSAQHYVVA